MPRVAPEKLVRAEYPRATVERQRGRGPFGKPYYLVRKERGAYMWTGCGDTPAQAWRDAAVALGLLPEPEPEVKP